MIVPKYMQAMVLETLREPLVYKTVPFPAPTVNQVLIKVLACGVCRTDLHIYDGELNHPKLPLRHDIIDQVVSTGTTVTTLRKSDFVGIACLGYTCGQCKYCLHNKENLCEKALFNGYTSDGGYAKYAIANELYCFPIAADDATFAATPLLCAGLIGYRSCNMMGEPVKNIGIYGFGAATHIITQVAVYQDKKVFAFTRKGDVAKQQFALGLGAVCARSATELPPQLLEAAIIFASADNLIPKTLMGVEKGGILVCGGIHMSDMPFSLIAFYRAKGFCVSLPI